MDTKNSSESNSSGNNTSTAPNKADTSDFRRTQNENVLTINVHDEPSHGNCAHGVASQVAISPHPLQLDINSSTDWPTVLVGCAGILSSIVIARYTSKIQTNQINSNIANLRQSWIEELRDCAANFMEKMTFILNKTSDDKQYLNLTESIEPYSAMLSSQIKFGLMLDMQHDKNRRAMELSVQIINLIKLHTISDKIDEIGRLGNEFEDLVRQILEGAWQDIKRDLQGHR